MLEKLNGYEAFKNAREKAGYSCREFAKMADISLSGLVYYENGQRSLLGMPVKKALEVFGILDINVYDFYMDYFAEELDVTAAVAIWRESHPREYSVKKLNQRFKNRIFKLQERGQITPVMYEMLAERLRVIFGQVAKESMVVSDEFYEEYVLDFKYQIGKCIEDNRMQEEQLKNEIAIRIHDCILHSDYTYKDLSEMIGMHKRSLSDCKKNAMNCDYINLRMEHAMKICNVFSKRFEELF